MLRELRGNVNTQTRSELLFERGDDVLVDFDGGEFPGEVLKSEASGYVLCRIHTDPEWDFGMSSAWVMPEQVVAVRTGNIKPADKA
jgi:hypothetical protein